MYKLARIYDSEVYRTDTRQTENVALLPSVQSDLQSLAVVSLHEMRCRTTDVPGTCISFQWCTLKSPEFYIPNKLIKTHLLPKSPK
jgi:hypothetical protein